MNNSSKKPDIPRGAPAPPGPERDGFAGYTSRVLSSFRYPVYRLYYYSMVGHWAPMQMQMVVRSLLIFRLTGSGTILGLMSLAHSIPMVLLSLYGGALADRLEKRQMLIFSQIGSGILAFGVAISLTTGYLTAENSFSWWVLMASSAIEGIVFGLMMPARASVLPEIVEPKDLMNAISLNNLGMNVFRIISPAAGGFIVAAWDFSTAFYIMTFLYLSTTVFLFAMPKMHPKVKQFRSTFGEILEGLKYLRKEVTITLILAFTLGCTILGQPFNMLLPMFTDSPELLNVGSEGLGILMAVSGIGAVIMSLALASMGNQNRGIYMLFTGLILSASLIAFSFINVWGAALVIVFFIGMAQTGQMALGSTLVQYHVDPAYRGRVMSFQMLGFGLSSLGTVFGGVMADTMGIQWSVGGLALGLGLMTLLILVFGRKLRRLD